MDYSTKIDIGKLEGKENWSTWKYKISVLLDGTEGALEAVEGKLQKPTPLASGAGDADLSTYAKAMAKYKKTEAGALLMLTTNMTEETLKKVMRYRTAREVWLELHRLFDGETEGRIYSLCLEFFGMKHSKEDDIPTLMSKLKNIWNEMCVEVSKIDPTAKLPEVLLICKVLDTLDDRFFNFKSSWLLLKQTEKTIDSLTSHLCVFERDLGSQENFKQEALVTKSIEGNAKSMQRKDEQLICNYCSGRGHRVRKCKKWIKDGRPPKPTSSTSLSGLKSKSVQQTTVMHSLPITTCAKDQVQDRESWFVDNGATTHIAVRSDVFNEFHEFDLDHTVATADGTMIPALGYGTVVVEANVNGKKMQHTLKNVWLVPSLTKNLFSTLAAQDILLNSVFTSTTRECKLEVAGTTRVIGRRVPGGGLYKLDMKSVMPIKRRMLEVNAVTGFNMLQLYHERFAHQDKKHVIRVVKRELGITLSPDKAKCEGCLYGKSHRKPFGTRERALAPGELIHTDVCGPFENSISKYKYFVLFKDDYSSYRMVYFIRQKSEVKDKLLQMLQEAKTAGHVVKTLLSDNGGEFDNESIRKILQNHGIKHRLTMPYTPEQNGCSERENRTLVESMRSMLYARGELPKVLWAELINTAAYVLNRTGPTRVDAKVPYELWYGKKPRISHLKVIGSECYAHIPVQRRKKLDKKAMKGTLIGYENDDGYRVWDGTKTLRSRNITFETDVEFTISTNTPSEPEPNNEISHEHSLEGERMRCEDHVHDEEDPDQELFHDTMSENCVDDGGVFDNDRDRLEIIEPQAEVEPRYNLRDRSTIAPPKYLDDFECFLVNAERFPQIYEEAYSDADHEGDEQTGRSTTGVACLFAGGDVSTTEAEIVAVSEGARELVGLERVFRQLTTLDNIPTLKVDNEAAIRLAYNPEFHKRTKHIRIRHFFVREMVQEGLVDVQKTSSADQLADLLTKAVPRPRLNKLRADLGLHSLSN